MGGVNLVLYEGVNVFVGKDGVVVIQTVSGCVSLVKVLPCQFCSDMPLFSGDVTNI